MVPLPAGLVAVHWVVEAQLTLVPALTPNFTVVAPTMKFEPVIVTGHRCAVQHQSAQVQTFGPAYQSL